MSIKVEDVLSKKPKPGEVGGPMVGIAEAERIRKGEPDELIGLETQEGYTAAVEKASGKKIGDMTEEDFYRLPIILTATTKQPMTELHVVFKDPSMTGHWFNYKAKQPDRVMQARAQGFTACTREDVEFCHASQTDDSGALVYGDLVLMKIPKAILWGGYYRRNMERAAAAVDRGGMQRLERMDRVAGTQYEAGLTGQTVDVDFRGINEARGLTYQQ